MSETPRYATLRDYLRVVRANRWLILATTVVFALAALGYSLLQTKVYTAEAQVNFQNITADLSLLGSSATAPTPPNQLAAMNASLITRPAVTARVARRLNTSSAALGGKVSTQVGATTNLVGIKVTDPDPALAAQIANAYAVVVTDLANRAVHVRLQRAINSVLKAAGNGQAATFGQQQAQALLNQLKTAQAVVQPAQVAERATAPTTPSGPRTKRNTVLGAMVGLVIGLVIAFFRDALDRRLRIPSDVHDETGFPVLGRISEESLGSSVVPQNGAKALTDPDFEAFRVLRANIEFLRVDQPLKRILVTSGLPEEGKSTVAAALAAALTGAGRRTLLVECDLRRPSLSGRLGLSRSPGLSDYLVGSADPQEVLQSVRLPFAAAVNGKGPKEGGEAGGASLVCITAGTPVPQPGELLGSERFRAFLDQVSEAYEVVVLDTSPLLSVVDGLELVPQVDGVLVCVRLAQTTRQEARAARDALARLPERPTGAVVTGTRPGDEGYGYYYQAYGADS